MHDFFYLGLLLHRLVRLYKRSANDKIIQNGSTADELISSTLRLLKQKFHNPLQFLPWSVTCAKEYPFKSLRMKGLLYPVLYTWWFDRRKLGSAAPFEGEYEYNCQLNCVCICYKSSQNGFWVQNHWKSPLLALIVMQTKQHRIVLEIRKR